MTRYIDADALIACLQKDPLYPLVERYGMSGVIDEQPTIDAVPKEKILLLLNIAKEELSKAHANKSVNGIMTWSASVTTLEGLLKEYDTADTDIVPVIRCKDCRWFINKECAIYCLPSAFDEAYCYYAERRGEE